MRGSKEKGYDEHEKEQDFTWAVDLAVTPEMLPELRVLSDTAPGVAIEGLGAHGVLPGMVPGQRAGAYIVSQLVSQLVNQLVS